jgi:hypothetical protein
MCPQRLGLHLSSSDACNLQHQAHEVERAVGSELDRVAGLAAIIMGLQHVSGCDSVRRSYWAIRYQTPHPLLHPALQRIQDLSNDYAVGQAEVENLRILLSEATRHAELDFEQAIAIKAGTSGFHSTEPIIE